MGSDIFMLIFIFGIVSFMSSILFVDKLIAIYSSAQKKIDIILSWGKEF